jgi:hypothetical protein
MLENMPVPADVRVWPEAVALRDAGFQVSVIGPKDEGAHRASHEVIDGIDVYRYALSAGNSPVAYLLEYSIALLMTVLLSIKVWCRRRFEVIHAVNPPDTFFLLAWLFRP